MSIFNLITFSIGAFLCFYLSVKITLFAYLTYSERASWWLGNDYGRIKVSWVDFALGAAGFFLFGFFCLICIAEELLK